MNAHFRTGIKDNLVYLDIYDASETIRYIDGTFAPENARILAHNLIIAADAIDPPRPVTVR